MQKKSPTARILLNAARRVSFSCCPDYSPGRFGIFSASKIKVSLASVSVAAREWIAPFAGLLHP
jgi:hypothetical protein